LRGVFSKKRAMISPEVLRRYPFFAGLSHQQIVNLAKVADELSVEADHYFFHEEEDLSNCFYLVLTGAVAIVIEVPDQGAEQKISDQLMGELKTKDIVVSALGPGEVFGWSALVPPQIHSRGKSYHALPGSQVQLPGTAPYF
jgi:CRP-like cAMP-binding protein